jgi:hypothetical protein
MAISGTVMIAASSQNEYAVLVTEKTGVTHIHHLNKNHDLIDPYIFEIIEARANPVASGRHYFVNEKKSTPALDAEVSLVEIACNYPRAVNKWEALNFTDAYLDMHFGFNFHTGAVQRTIGYSKRPAMVTFTSFIKFMHQAYPIDYARWKLLDPNLEVVRRKFAVPTLP